MRGRSLLLCTVLLAACGDADETTAVEPIYEVPESVDALSGERWLDHPWPSELRVVDGTVQLEGFINPRLNALLDEYIGFADGRFDGFSPAGAGYLRFTGALDEATLPVDPAATLEPDASVQLIDVDPDSPGFGERTPIRVSFRADGGTYVLPHTLRFIPVPGYPLRPSTRYALAVTDAVRAADGSAVRPSDTLASVLGERAASGAAAELASRIAPDLDGLRNTGVDPASLVHLTTFETDDPTAEVIGMADHLAGGGVPAPDFSGDWQVDDRGDWIEYRARFGPIPRFQHGTLPFTHFGDGGGFELDEQGEPVMADTFDLRFSLSVPDESVCAMPDGGYPIVLYAHGTGGSWRSYTGYADTLAERCIAVMGVDQIFHGDYPGAPEESFEMQLLFFNFQNVEAARTNGRQSALDEVQRARLFTETKATIPASVAHTGNEIRFDPEKVMFFGHSQGGLNGPLYLAIDDSARGGVLSGSSSVMSITLLEKTEPEPSIAALVPTVFLGLKNDELDEYDIFHPAIMLAQTLVDAIDPIHYARYTAREPIAGGPKSVLMTEGIAPDGSGDSYSPPAGIEAQAVAMGLPLMEPVVFPIPQLALGAETVTIPPEGLSGNVGEGAASGVLAQWAPPADSDGHFVVFDVEAARSQVAGFLEALAADPTGRVPAP